MTEPHQAPGGSPGTEDSHDAAPELRASHHDRDRVVEILRVAAGDGRLTAEELDDRVEAALSARTGSELARLTADLPASGVLGKPRDLIRIDQRFGDVSRTGRWVVPKRMEIRLKGGDAKIDFTEAVITQDTLHIDLDLGWGADLLFVTKPGIVVSADDVSVSRGDVKIKSAYDPYTPVVLHVEVSGRIRGGDLVARLPRRTFWQWLHRAPRPYRSSGG
jgi:hypothetical protein